MDAVTLRGRRWLIAWVTLLVLLIVVTRLAVVLIAVNGREELPSQLLSDAVAVAVVLHVAFSGYRVAKWLGVLLFAMWGLVSIGAAVSLGGAVTFRLRGEIFVLLAVGVGGVVVQALAVLTGGACLGFAGVLVGSHSINRYLAHRRAQSASW